MPVEGIVVENVSKTYKGGKIHALKGLSLEVKPGEVFGLIGPNGAGKTTFFGCLLAYLKIDSGSILIDGLRSDSVSLRRKIGYLPERLTFDRWMTGLDFMLYHHALAEQADNTRTTDCEALLNQVALKPEAWNLPIKKYSRGMLQRLGFAQALVGKPKYLLLDEPASGVDPGGVLLLRNLLRDLKSTGMTIVINSHQLDQLERVCDRVAFIKGGKVEALENMQDVHASLRFIVRWLESERPDLEGDIKRIVAEHGSQIVELQGQSVTIDAPDSQAIAIIIRDLVKEGIEVIHSLPQGSRLERFFAEEDKVSK